MGRSRSSISPYCPKISRMWSSLTFLVRRSTTIWNRTVSAVDQDDLVENEANLPLCSCAGAEKGSGCETRCDHDCSSCPGSSSCCGCGSEGFCCDSGSYNAHSGEGSDRERRDRKNLGDPSRATASGGSEGWGSVSLDHGSGPRGVLVRETATPWRLAASRRRPIQSKLHSSCNSEVGGAACQCKGNSTELESFVFFLSKVARSQISDAGRGKPKERRA